MTLVKFIGHFYLIMHMVGILFVKFIKLFLLIKYVIQSVYKIILLIKRIFHIDISEFPKV